MKAIVYTKYGSPEVLELREIKNPLPKPAEVLIKVHAVSINSWDWDLLRGIPLVNRLMFGILKPNKILGCDIAGEIEAVGTSVTNFKVGDRVLGDLSGCGWGGLAEYVCGSENALRLKPEQMTYEQAAAVPQAGLLALQGLRDEGGVKANQSVLINGAGGGVGSFAIQLAKLVGAKVTGVDRASKFKMMRSLGADHVVDYTQEDFTKKSERYDLILDVMGFHSLLDYRRVLNPDGRYIMVGGSMTLANQLILMGRCISRMGRKKMQLLLHKPNKGLDIMLELFEAGTVVPMIDQIFPFSDACEAFRYFGKGEVQGKVVISVR